MDVKSMEMRTPPSLGFWPILAVDQNLDSSRRGSARRLLVRLPRPAMLPPLLCCELGPRSQEQNIFPCCDSQKEQAQANMCAQPMFG